jgi:hypothetical protein
MDSFPYHSFLSPTAIFWIAIVAIVFFGNFFGYRAQVSRHRMIEKLAEKGQPIPPEFQPGPEDYAGRRYRFYYRYRHPIQSGIYLMCIGAALFLFFWAMTGGGNLFEGERVPHWLPFVAIFPFMIGLARFLGGLFDRPRSE